MQTRKSFDNFWHPNYVFGINRLRIFRNDVVLTVVSVTARNHALPTMIYRLISSIVFYIVLYMQPTNVDYGLGIFRSHRAPETLSLSAASSFLKHSFQLDDHRSYHLSLLVERVRSRALYLLLGDLSPLLSRLC